MHFKFKLYYNAIFLHVDEKYLLTITDLYITLINDQK
jgi:hypothetical protein